jgi:pentatricopeptide repeat protein
MKKHSFVPNQQTYTILLNGIAENQTFEDNITQAKHLLEDIQKISTRHNQVKINVIHVNCFLKVCSRSNNFEALIENFNELINEGDWEPNQETYTIILNSCARHDSGYEIALKLWEQLNINPKNSKNKQKEIDQELEWGLAKRSDNIIIDDNLVRSMLFVCKNFNDYQKGFEIIKNFYGLESDVNVSKPPSFICNLSPQTLDVILEICVKKQYDKGIKLFDDALSQFPDLPLDIYIFNKLINLCNKAGEYDKAISIIKIIQERGLRLNLQTYDLLLISCKNNEDWTTAKNLYIKMLHNDTKVFDSRILNKMFELAEIQRVKNKSLSEIKWLLNLSHEITLQNFNTSMENEKKEIYHYKKLLRQIKKAYEVLIRKQSDLIDVPIKHYKKGLNEIKIKLNEAKKKQKKKKVKHNHFQ